MICPQCGSTNIRNSRRARWGDVFQRIRGLAAFRCRKCRQRFFASDSAEPGQERIVQSKQSHRPKRLISSQTKHRLIRRLIVIAIFTVAFALFWYFLRYLTTEPRPASDSGAVSAPLAFFLS
jgi:hypothetical protein